MNDTTISDLTSRLRETDPADAPDLADDLAEKLAATLEPEEAGEEEDR